MKKLRKYHMREPFIERSVFPGSVRAPGPHSDEGDLAQMEHLTGGRRKSKKPSTDKDSLFEWAQEKSVKQR
jgi:hypothetical protein